MGAGMLAGVRKKPGIPNGASRLQTRQVPVQRYIFAPHDPHPQIAQQPGGKYV
jgi:hypothetical protein